MIINSIVLYPPPLFSVNMKNGICLFVWLFVKLSSFLYLTSVFKKEKKKTHLSPFQSGKVWPDFFAARIRYFNL